MKVDTHDDGTKALTRLLHDEVDTVKLAEGWTDIETRIGKRRASRRRSAPVAVGVSCAVMIVTAVMAPGLLARLQSSQTSATVASDPATRSTAAVTKPLWPASSMSKPTAATPNWRRTPGGTAHQFLVSLGLSETRLASTTGVVRNGSGETVVTVQNARGLTVARVHLAISTQNPGLWEVVSVESPSLTVRSPSAGDRFDSPMSVSFRSTSDADVDVRLYAVGTPDPLAQWAGTVDGAMDWTANTNFAITTPGTAAFVAVTATDKTGDVVGVRVFPVTLGS